MKKIILTAISVLAAVVAVGCQDITNEGGQNLEGPEIPASKDVPYYLYGVAEIEIKTDNNRPVDSKDPADYRPCTIEISGTLADESGNEVDCSYNGRGKIRGRGNSTWEWYDKKPYRIKLDETSRIMGMKKNRDWVLLADYRDVTHLMNNVGFTMAHYLGIPYTNHLRYAEVTLNGKYIGLYAVTEQVEEGDHRVDVTGDGGYLLGLDVNDGPGDCPGATDNFWSEIYSTAVCVKYPEDPTPSQLRSAKEAFAELEEAISGQDWEEINEMLDVKSMIDYILIQEAICNVEMNNGNSIRSGYINKKPDGKWTMGPLWDCDGGFCYNWGDMYDNWGWGHTYFESYTNLIFGSDPYNQTGAYGWFPDFFSDLFGIPEFVKALKKEWKDNSTGMLAEVLRNIDAVWKVTGEAMKDDASLWGIDNYMTKNEVDKMKAWLSSRFKYLDGVISAYPEDPTQGGGGVTPEPDNVEIVETIIKNAEFAIRGGHYTGCNVDLSRDDLKKIGNSLGIDANNLAEMVYSGAVALAAVEPDGRIVYETTASDSYGDGFWYTADGYVTYHGQNSYIFAEIAYWENQFKLGYHPDICIPGNYFPAVAFVYGDKAVKLTFNITTDYE